MRSSKSRHPIILIAKKTSPWHWWSFCESIIVIHLYVLYPWIPDQAWDEVALLWHIWCGTYIQSVYMITLLILSYRQKWNEGERSQQFSTKQRLLDFVRCTYYTRNETTLVLYSIYQRNERDEMDSLVLLLDLFCFFLWVWWVIQGDSVSG